MNCSRGTDCDRYMSATCGLLLIASIVPPSAFRAHKLSCVSLNTAVLPRNDSTGF
jgi:hypothetical protein